MALQGHAGRVGLAGRGLPEATTLFEKRFLKLKRLVRDGQGTGASEPGCEKSSPPARQALAIGRAEGPKGNPASVVPRRCKRFRNEAV